MFGIGYIWPDVLADLLLNIYAGSLARNREYCCASVMLVKTTGGLTQPTGSERCQTQLQREFLCRVLIWALSQTLLGP